MSGSTVPPDVRAWLDSQAAAVRANRRYTRAFDMDRLGHDYVTTATRVNVDTKLDAALSLCSRFDSAHPSVTRSAPKSPPPKAALPAPKVVAPVVRADAAPIDEERRLRLLELETAELLRRLPPANTSPSGEPAFDLERIQAVDPTLLTHFQDSRHMAHLQREVMRCVEAGGTNGGKLETRVDHDDTGRMFRRFYGDISVMMRPFSNGRRLVRQFLTGSR